MVYCTYNLLNMFRTLICCCVWLKTLIRNLLYCECIKRLYQIDHKSTILQEQLYFKALSNRQLWSCYLLIDTWRNWLELLDMISKPTDARNCAIPSHTFVHLLVIMHTVCLLHVSATPACDTATWVAATWRRYTMCIIYFHTLTCICWFWYHV
jgi:hypothetical protein